MTVGEMLSRITSRELTEWLAYFHLQANPPKRVQTPDEVRSVLSAMTRKK